MKNHIKLFILGVIALLSFSSPVLAEETASPTTASLIFDGQPLDVAAYNIYGNNYVMLRDMAVIFNGTQKQFNVEWSYGTVKITENQSYIGVLNENDSTDKKQAALSDHTVLIDGIKSHITGYNIDGSNYYKLRDIALFMDFGVSYDNTNRKVIIDTSKAYTPEPVYGEAVAYEANLPLFINEQPIISYYVTNNGAYNDKFMERIRKFPQLAGVWIDALQLENYGFDVSMDSFMNVSVNRNPDKLSVSLDTSIINSIASNVISLTTIDSMNFDGTEIYSMGVAYNRLIPAVALCDYTEPDVLPQYRSPNVGCDSRINFDIERADLTAKYNSANGEEISMKADLSNPDTITEIHTMFPSLPESIYAAEINIKPSAIMGKYSLETSNYETKKYVGGCKQLVKSGHGIYNYSYSPKTGSSAYPYNSFERGLFENDKLIRGVSYTRAHYNGSSGYVEGIRNDGDRTDGYLREGIVCNGFRFGYRIVCEGEIENGEYCGSYKRYYDSGKLIFDGQYQDYTD